ncbi:MAG: hypothetical protein ACJA14_000353 [Ilumatobacter sp.]
MKANTLTTTATSDISVQRTPRRARRSIAAAVVGLLALSACTSDPGPKRVVQDIVEAEAVRNPNLDEQCMLDAIDEFSGEELEKMANDLDSSDENAAAQAAEDFESFNNALEACTI